jgi:hypothetical protein
MIVGKRKKESHMCMRKKNESGISSEIYCIVLTRDLKKKGNLYYLTRLMSLTEF